MLTIGKLERYDMVNTPGDDKPSFTVWFSGCSFKCIGCHNPYLKNPENGEKYNVDTVLFAICSECERLGIDTVVLLGGEPLEQEYDDLMTLIQKLSEYGYKIWLYTGWNFDQIPTNMLQYLYTVKSGKFDINLWQDGFPSSSNQKVHRKTDNTWQEIKL